MRNKGLREVVFLNGKFLSPDKAKVSVLEPGFLYGWGIFETMRFYGGGVIYLDTHLKRLKASAKLIGLGVPYSEGKLKKIIGEAVKRCTAGEIYIRLTLFKSLKGAGILLIARKYQPYPPRKYKKGFSAGVCPFRQNEKSFLAQIKTTSYILYKLAYSWAKREGFDEAVVLNSLGHIAEGSRANIFFAKRGKIFTPALECGCLSGVTRQAVFELAKGAGFKVHAGKFRPADLYAADEAFMTNSLIGVMPLVSVGNRLIGAGKPGKITLGLMEKYNALSRDEKE